MESCVKNCGVLIHDEVATKAFMEEMRELVKQTTDDNIKNKVRFIFLNFTYLEISFCGSEMFIPETGSEFFSIPDKKIFIPDPGSEFFYIPVPIFFLPDPNFFTSRI
jgi:hypothetical protein